MSKGDGLPDLLRRFVATPYRFAASLNTTVISFETNDQDLLATVRARADELARVLMSPPGRRWYWKIVRDYDVCHNGDEPYLLGEQTLSTLFLGTGTVVGIDWQRGELLGFVAANIPTDHLLDALITMAQQHHLDCERRSTEWPHHGSSSA